MWWFCILIGLAAGFLAGLSWKRHKPALIAGPDGRMQLWKATALLGYLLAATALSVYVAYGLWAAEPRGSPQTPKPAPDCSKSTSPAPEIHDLDPEQVYLGSSRANIRVLGCNFAAGDTVRFDGVQRSSHFVDPRQLLVALQNSDFGIPGEIAVSVLRAASGASPAVESNAKALMIQSALDAKATWYFFYWSRPINQEVRLLLLVLVAGVLGSSTYALKSLADYIGNKKLSESWFTYYLVWPFKGAGIAFIFYVTMRGGLLAGTSIDVKVVNPFGICAIAALVGAFSDLALAKLREVFLTLFRSTEADARSDKIGGKLAFAAKSPLAAATQGQTYSHKLAVTGGSPPYKWAPVTPLPVWLTLDENTGELRGVPSAATAATRYEVKVSDSTGATAIAEFELTVGA